MGSWSPFDCLVVAEQTQAGLLKKEPTEVDLLVVENVELRSANIEPMVPINENNQADYQKTSGGAQWIDRASNLMIQLTTHRIVFWKSTTDTTNDKHQRAARYLHHSQILNVSPETAYFKSPKLLLNTAALGETFRICEWCK